MARVLIVDDMEVDLLLQQAILARCGHETYSATDGEEALRICEEHDIDVVVTDLHMPGLHGFELISILRDFSPRPSIIAVSGTGAVQLEVAHELGAQFTLQKPVIPERLINGVEQALAARATVGGKAVQLRFCRLPIGYTVDIDRRFVFVRAWGMVTDDALRLQAQALKSDPRMDPDFGLLVDSRDVTGHAMTLALLQSYPSAFSRLSHRAIVVGDVYGLALGEAYSAWNAESGSGLVTRYMSEALAWLGLSPSMQLPDQLDASFGLVPS